MGSDKAVQSAGKAGTLSKEDRMFLQEVVERDRAEHHGRLSYMDIMFEL